MVRKGKIIRQAKSFFITWETFWKIIPSVTKSEWGVNEELKYGPTISRTLTWLIFNWNTTTTYSYFK